MKNNENKPVILYGDDAGPKRELEWSFTTDEIARWNQIWPQAISMAWSDDAFRDALLADGRKALEGYLGYTFPAEISLEVLDATGLEGITHDGKPGTAGYTPADDGGVGHWMVPATNVQIWLPPKPDGVELEAVALASYGTRGRIYPFTCCI